MILHLKKSLFILLFCGLALPATAADLRHAELQKFEGQGGTVEFLGHALGLDGWLLINKEGAPSYAYTSKDGGLVVGMLVGPDGNVVTRDQLLAYKARAEGGQGALPGADKTAISKAEHLYAVVEKSSWVRVGSEDAPYLYMFTNIDCEHCQAFWQDLQGPIKAGKLQVRLVPSGALPVNRDGGAALLSANDPAAAWNAYIEGKTDVLSAKNATKEALAQIDMNTALLKDWNVPVMPFTIYRKTSDGVVTVLMGRPDNMLLVMADLMQVEKKTEEQP